MIKNKFILTVSFFLLFSCSKNYEINWVRRDLKPYYQIFNEEKVDEFKWAVEISFTTDSKVEVNIGQFKAKKDNLELKPIGFASLWISYDDKYYFNSYESNKEIENVSQILYLLFDNEPKDYKMHFNNNEITLK